MPHKAAYRIIEKGMGGDAGHMVTWLKQGVTCTEVRRLGVDAV